VKITDLKIGESVQVTSGHITESDDFNEKYPKVSALCEKQDELRGQGSKIIIELTEGLKKLEAMCAKIPPGDFPDPNQRSNESKEGYLYKVKSQLANYEKALEIFMHNGAC
jgi:hypothetical protein